jgi:hypothetical protein
MQRRDDRFARMLREEVVPLLGDQLPSSTR